MITNRDIVIPLDVPRVAWFEDLRVGQWVAVAGPDARGPWAGVVEKVMQDGFRYVDPHNGEWTLHRSDVNNGGVIILRDAPAPPVTVRRDLWDNFAGLVAGIRMDTLTHYQRQVIDAACVLIDNADVGDTL